MHDPESVAFDLYWPFLRRKVSWHPGYERYIAVTIWHVDPETAGFEDSCIRAAWYRKDLTIGLEGKDAITRNESEEIEIMRWRRKLLSEVSWLSLRLPWRWHFWHWRIQFHAIQNLKRCLFSRCARCGKRFRWGESCVHSGWSGTGALWFRSESNLYHWDCHKERSAEVAAETRAKEGKT